MRAIPVWDCLHFLATNNRNIIGLNFYGRKEALYNAVRKIITLADGRQIEIETGKAGQTGPTEPSSSRWATPCSSLP